LTKPVFVSYRDTSGDQKSGVIQELLGNDMRTFNDFKIIKGGRKRRDLKVKSASLDSEILMSNALNKKREFIILNLDKEISKKNFDDFQNMVTERIKGKPIAYLINKKFFWKYEFFVNKKVLIPRPDTEIIVENVLKIYKKKK